MAQALDELSEVRERLRTDTPFWAAHCATILNERRQEVPLIARPWQARTAETLPHVRPLDEVLEDQRRAGVPMRAIILKARKLGFSTWIQAKFVQRVSLFPFEYALTVAHLRQSVGPLFDMATLMYERLPNDRELAELIYGPGTGRAAPFSVKPTKLYSGSTRQGNRWMTLGERLRQHEASIYETMTAGAKGGGRASTPSMLHLSEAAHYEDPNFLVGVLNAVPKEPGSIVVIESTALGFNHFHERWQRAVDGAEDPETGGLYTPLFYGWQDNPRNALPFISDQARDRFERTIGDPDGGGDEEEPWLVEQFGCTLEQLRWRRVTIDEECGGDVELFHQEHPATPEQAFIGSGRPVFPGILVARAIKQAEQAPAPVAGVVRGLEWKERRTRSGMVLVPQSAMWVASADMLAEDVDRWGLESQLLVWEHPVNELTEAGREKRRPDGQYVVFVDIAQGEGTSESDRDYNVIQVLDHVSRLQVARYRSRVAIHDLPILCYLVALYYNRAWLAPEKTGLGVGVVDALAKDLRYPRLYRTHRPGDDQRPDAVGDRLGWETTPRTKPLLEQTFGQMLKSGEHGLRDLATAREATTYVEDSKNRAKHGAQPGSHDDLLIAFMGAHRVAAELRPRDPEKKRRPRRHVDDPLTGY